MAASSVGNAKAQRFAQGAKSDFLARSPPRLCSGWSDCAGCMSDFEVSETRFIAGWCYHPTRGGQRTMFHREGAGVGALTVSTVTRKNNMLATAAIDSFVAAQPYEADLAPELSRCAA